MFSVCVILKGLNKELAVLQAIWKTTKITIDMTIFASCKFRPRKEMKASLFDVCLFLFFVIPPAHGVCTQNDGGSGS